MYAKPFLPKNFIIFLEKLMVPSIDCIWLKTCVILQIKPMLFELYKL